MVSVEAGKGGVGREGVGGQWGAVWEGEFWGDETRVARIPWGEDWGV